MKRPSPSMVVATLALVFAVGGTGIAASGLITGADVKDGSLTGKDIAAGSISPANLSTVTKQQAVENATRRGPRGPRGYRGLRGLRGYPGAAGAAGAPGSAQAAGFVDNSSGTPAMSKARGGVSVRRAGNGIFCITAPGVDPNTTPITAVVSAKSGAFGLILVGSGLAFSQLCTGSEFQVITVAAANFNVGLNNVSFEFMIP